jgi:hypothetical protein
MVESKGPYLLSGGMILIVPGLNRPVQTQAVLVLVRPLKLSGPLAQPGFWRTRTREVLAGVPRASGPKAALAVAAGHMEAASRAQSERTPISAVDYYVFIMDASERARSLASDS